MGARMEPGPSLLARKTPAKPKIKRTIVEAGKTKPETVVVFCARPKLKPLRSKNAPQATPSDKAS